MVKKSFTRVSLCLLVLAFSVTALAASKEGIVTINGGRQTVRMNPPTNARVAPAHRDAKLKTIYSNLGTGTDLYYCCEGWTISGTSSPVGEAQWIGAPFTPTKAAKVTKIDVAVGYVEGTNQIVVKLAADASGLPGKTMHSWTFKNMPTFGSSYTLLDTVKDTKGIKVGKKQYWVTVTTNTKDADLWGAWCFTWNFATGTYAYEINDGGWQSANSDLVALDVKGN